MRAVLQRVTEAQVQVDGQTRGSIQAGLLVFLGVSTEDNVADADYLATKIAALRIFADSNGKMNLSLGDSGGAALVVSQFTLYGDCRKGRRPSFDQAAAPQVAVPLYTYFVERLKALGLSVSTGVFQAHMQVKLINDGPVTFLLDSKKFELDRQNRVSS